MRLANFDFQDKFQDSSVALYIHVPFCDRLCHYCDFAKTSRFDPALTDSYFSTLLVHLRLWHKYLGRPRFSSVFFGGGTPSIFTEEYGPIFEYLQSYVDPQIEVSLECNPKHASVSNLERWLDLGVNRISLGVQSFEDEGLQVLTRDHRFDDVIRAIENVQGLFAKYSVDLIYGWAGQTIPQWKKDLEWLQRLAVPHVSAYNLIYEPGTTLHRQKERGLVQPLDEGVEFQMYKLACEGLAGLNHYEISNWSYPGHESIHNQLYWRMQSYLGLGFGAHSYLNHPADPVGVRFGFPKQISGKRIREFEVDAIEVDERGIKEWKQEALLSSLRTSRGVSLDKFFSKSEMDRITALVKENDDLNLSDDNLLTLSPLEWFREGYWLKEIMGRINL